MNIFLRILPILNPSLSTNKPTITSIDTKTEMKHQPFTASMEHVQTMSSKTL